MENTNRSRRQKITLRTHSVRASLSPMKLTRSAIVKTVLTLFELAHDVRKATVYLSDNYVIRACHRSRPSARSRSTTILLTYGKPNFREREFIRSCKKAGEPIPVRKVQLQWFAKKAK